MYKLLPILLFAFGLAITTDKIYDNSYALIIGISEYQNYPELEYPAQDALILSNLLNTKFNFPNSNPNGTENDA